MPIYKIIDVKQEIDLCFMVFNNSCMVASIVMLKVSNLYGFVIKGRVVVNCFNMSLDISINLLGHSLNGIVCKL